MSPRYVTSEPDQAFRQPQTAWQRERARGQLQPMDERMGRHWVWDFLGGLIAALLIGFMLGAIL